MILLISWAPSLSSLPCCTLSFYMTHQTRKHRKCPQTANVLGQNSEKRWPKDLITRKPIRPMFVTSSLKSTGILSFLPYSDVLLPWTSCHCCINSGHLFPRDLNILFSVWQKMLKFAHHLLKSLKPKRKAQHRTLHFCDTECLLMLV